MNNINEKKWRKSLDNLLILNLSILIIGAFILLISFILSINGNYYLLNIFQKLWYPLFIPSLSLFFTAILIEFTLTNLIDRESK